MKKVSIIAVVALVVVIPLLIFVFSGKCKSSIPLVQGLSWKSTPKQTAQLLGEPLEEWLDSNVTEKNKYVYRVNVLGREASVLCLFANNKTLTDLYFTWENCDEDFSDQVYECIYSYCSKDKNFYVEESDYPPNYEKNISMGINNGATGISYKIKQNGTTVEVICIHLF